jgi:ribosome-binding protein aMBF1 (putative translation factor)
VITPDQIKAARKLLGWSTATLAIKSNRTVIEVANAESGKLQPRTAETSLQKIQAAFEDAGVEFVDGGVRLSSGPPPVSTTITAAQIQEARRLLGWSLNMLSDRARMGVGTIKNAEQSTLVPRYAERQLLAIRRAFEAAGVDFADGRATIEFRTGEASPPRLRKKG